MSGTTSELHNLDQHAPFPHYLVTTSETVKVRNPNNPRLRIEEVRIFTFVICAVCGHAVEIPRPDCGCRASCHGTMT